MEQYIKNLVISGLLIADLTVCFFFIIQYLMINVQLICKKISLRTMFKINTKVKVLFLHKLHGLCLTIINNAALLHQINLIDLIATN